MLRRPPVGEQLGVPQDGGHRGPDLMAHVGEELGLHPGLLERSAVGLVGDMQRLIGSDELPRTLADLDLESFATEP